MFSLLKTHLVILLDMGQVVVAPGVAIYIAQLSVFYNGNAAKFNASFSDFLSVPGAEGAPYAPLSYYDILHVLPSTNAYGIGELVSLANRSFGSSF